MNLKSNEALLLANIYQNQNAYIHGSVLTTHYKYCSRVFQKIRYIVFADLLKTPQHEHEMGYKRN